jgi:hypothetical protein
MRNPIAAMKHHGVKRIVNLSASGLNNDKAVPGSAVFTYFIRPVFLRHMWADRQRSESLLTSSGLNYVNVQPGRLLALPARGGPPGRCPGLACDCLVRGEIQETATLPSRLDGASTNQPKASP